MVFIAVTLLPPFKEGKYIFIFLKRGIYKAFFLLNAVDSDI